jgi:peptide/nickel transport system substrate-binding protein
VKNLKLLFVVVIFFLGCGQNKRENEMLCVCLESFPSVFDPRYSSDLTCERLFSLIHRGLFKLDKNMEAVGDIVENYSLEEKKLKIELKKDVFFSDGKKLDSDDVIYTLNSILKGERISPRRGELKVIEKIVKRGDFTLEIYFSEPVASILTLLNFGIVENDETFTPEKFPVGAGLYRIVKIKRGIEIELEENPYSKEKPKTKRVILKAIEDPTLRSLELFRGSLDIVVNDIPYDSIKSLKEKGFQVIRKNGTNYSYIGINCKKKPLDNKKVRKALAYAINREAILKNILNGFGREADSMLSPENWAYHSTSKIKYDPLLSEELLEKENIKRDKDGLRGSFSYKTSMNKTSKFIAEAIREDLRKIGFDLKIETLEWGTFYQDIKRGNFDLFSLNWIGINDPDAYRYRFSSSMTPPFGFNRGFYSNFQLDKVLLKGSREFDKEKRREIYSKVQEILSDDMPYINLWWPDIVVVANPSVKIYDLPPDGNFSFIKDVDKIESSKFRH